MSFVLLLPALALLVYLLYPILPIFVSLVLSPLSRLPSPPTPSFFLGNLTAIADQENNDVISAWTRTYGSTFTYRGFIRGRRLLTTDPAALNWILGHAYDFPKPEFVRASLAAMVAGDQGLLTVEGDVHRHQRKILNQAFTPTHIKSLLPIFWDKAAQLRDLLLLALDSPTPPVHITTPPASPRTPRSPVGSFSILRSLDPVRPTPPLSPEKPPVSPPGPGVVVDVLSWLARATLDVIGEAGFGYAFNALDSPDGACETNSELAAAFATIFTTARKFRVLNVLQSWFPLLRRYHPNGKAMAHAQGTIRRIGAQLIHERLADVVPAACDEPKEVAQHIGGNRDLLSVLVRANSADGLSQSEIVSQISTFLAAGHETTASALTWTLYALARAPDEQRALRKTLQSIPLATTADSRMTMDAILANPALDRVVHESLRLHAPVSLTMRVYDGAEMETVVPLSRGVRIRIPKPFLARLGWRPLAGLLVSFLVHAAAGWVGIALWLGLWLAIQRWRRKTDGDAEEFREGEWTVEDHVRLRRGDIISIPIQVVNRDPAVWGDDAREFRPSRWLNPPTSLPTVSGLYPHTLTFLNGSPINGNRACIGYRFALAEIKIFLFFLLRSLEFSIDDGVVVEKRVNVVTRPFVASAPEMGNQMPLRIRRVQTDV